MTDNYVVIVKENNADSLLVMQQMPEICGFPVVGVSSTSGVWTWRDEWSKILAKARLEDGGEAMASCHWQFYQHFLLGASTGVLIEGLQRVVQHDHCPSR